MKRKLKEARSEIQDYEEMVSKLRTHVTQLDCQLTTAKQVGILLITINIQPNLFN